MNNRIRLAAVAPFVVIMLALAGCDNGLSAPVPAVSPQTQVKQSQPTQTVDAVTLPTDVPAPTSVDNSPAPIDSATEVPTAPPTLKEPAKPSILFDALKKFAGAKTYRVDLSMNGKGYLGLSGDDTQPDPDTLLFDLKGDFRGNDGHYTLKGFLITLLGVEADTGLEAMLIGDKGYVKGPVALLGADQNQWYVLESDQTEAVTPPFQATDFLIDMGNSNADLSKFAKSGSESLDGKKCDSYSANESEAKKALSALNPGALPGVEDLSTVQNASVVFSLCDDGYIHRVQMSVTAANKDNAKQTTDFSVNLHVYDFNASVSITPPANSIPLKPVEMPTDIPATPAK